MAMTPAKQASPFIIKTFSEELSISAGQFFHYVNFTTPQGYTPIGITDYSIARYEGLNITIMDFSGSKVRIGGYSTTAHPNGGCSIKMLFAKSEDVLIQ